MPSVSVIIPNYNHARFLEQRIESVLTQTYQDFEIILLDDCSTDDSIDVLEQYKFHPKVSGLYVNEKNSCNAFRQWKKGIDFAVGEYIWIAESDDWADEKFLETLAPKLSKSNIVLAYCRSFEVRNMEIVGIDKWAEPIAPHRWDQDFVNSGVDELRNFMVFRNTMPNASAILFKKNAIEAISRFPLSMKYCGDWLIWGQIMALGNIYYSSIPMNYFRQHAKTTRHIPNIEISFKRLREYMDTILFLRKIAVLKQISITFTNKYDWILQEWLHTCSDHYLLLKQPTPPLAAPLLIRMYCMVLIKSCEKNYKLISDKVYCHLKINWIRIKRFLCRLMNSKSIF